MFQPHHFSYLPAGDSSDHITTHYQLYPANIRGDDDNHDEDQEFNDDDSDDNYDDESDDNHDDDSEDNHDDDNHDNHDDDNDDMPDITVTLSDLAAALSCVLESLCPTSLPRIA